MFSDSKLVGTFVHSNYRNKYLLEFTFNKWKSDGFIKFVQHPAPQ